VSGADPWLLEMQHQFEAEWHGVVARITVGSLL